MTDKVTIHAHYDADGVTSALFTAYHLKHKCDIVFPDKFGDVSNCNDGDYMVDMRPTENISGINVIDHHPGHFEEPNYNLIWKPYPAGKICWEEFKDDIPRKEWWKLVVSTSGDVAIYETPYEVWKEFPILFQKNKSSTWKRFGGGNTNKTFWSGYPFYQWRLSSPINALCRIGKPDVAYTLLKICQSPVQLVSHPDGIDAKEKVNKETDKAIKGSDMTQYDFHSGYGLMLIVYNSKYRISGRISAMLLSEPQYSNYTIMAINKKDGKGSMRGDLCNFFKGILEENLDYIKTAGHGVAMGVECDLKKINRLKYDIHAIMNEFVVTNQLWKTI